MDYSAVNEVLIIGTTPSVQDYALLESLGVRLVINMRLERPPYRNRHVPSLRLLWLPTLDSPFFPIPMHVFRRGVKAALEVIRNGGRVYVHCAAGRHRGVAMAAAILIALGHTPEQAMSLIKEKRAVADPEIWYIRWRILRFAEMWSIWKERQDSGAIPRCASRSPDG